MKDWTYDDRDRIDICKDDLGEKYYSGRYCKPSCECIKYIPVKLYKNNSFILNYSRKLKLIKIINDK